MPAEKKPLAPSEAIKLLDLLISDDAFRAQFQKAPSEALARINPEVAEACRDCCMPGPLASVESMLQAREHLIRQVAEQAMFSLPFCFTDAGQKPLP
ncbi:NHLP-related RiPP peptide [Stenotrophomonas humi]